MTAAEHPDSATKSESRTSTITLYPRPDAIRNVFSIADDSDDLSLVIKNHADTTHPATVTLTTPPGVTPIIKHTDSLTEIDTDADSGRTQYRYTTEINPNRQSPLVLTFELDLEIATERETRSVPITVTINNHTAEFTRKIHLTAQ